MEDLKSAEQLVKKKQQQENQQRTSELQQLVASQQQKSSPTPPTVSTVASSHTGKQIVLYGFLREINARKKGTIIFENGTAHTVSNSKISCSILVH